ncbi:hypothetical protein DFR24_3361 [Panacagrimonas perspica]|uniref:CVNH domain-containing protein n=1 Tax=Panacagrimonas perspica TaxID=381431 RepID=A0A4S3K2I7_9GAMM|nr:hypothetical protein [Panacagrimonas perspica]TDU28979.1 hypothetical protein DFR24_3361 [Panacagrimonas perspica]THD02203.1 hypothetical protein B1810_14815 [Panacagrimonas perspica]
MRYTLAFFFCVLSTVTQAAGADKACWDEWEYKDQAMLRAFQCTENISLSAAELAKTFCLTRIEGDTHKTAVQCPAKMKAKRGADVVEVKVKHTCTGISPMGLTGKAKIFYYEDPESDEASLKGLCNALGGTWASP